MTTIISTIRTWLSGHKKITAAALALVAAVVPDTLISADQKQHIIEVLLVYLGAQGVADHGKERAKVEGQTARDLAAFNSKS